tara:strand:+ start:1205 stop:1483 length:279 start_codon:yes stop_codon:yes gene_type:complete
MLDKYDSLQNKLGCEINELSTHNSDKFFINHENIIKSKLKKCGMCCHVLLGYFIGDKYYKVKLQTNDAILLITMEKEGRVLHILEDKTQGGI